jgi:TIR domain
MPGTIFLNYRRGDEPGFALALYGRLEHAFSAEQLFMDVEGGIPAGHDFVQVLETQVAQCDVLLALIGQDWLRRRTTPGHAGWTTRMISCASRSNRRCVWASA